MVLERFRCLAEGPGSVHHIVDNQAAPAFNITDDVHNLCFIGGRATLVDDGQIYVKLFRHRAGSHDTAHIRRHDRQVFIALPLDVLSQYR